MGSALAGPVFVIATSAFTPTMPDAVEVLFAKFGSGVVELTVAVFVTVPVAVEARANVDVMVAVPAGASPRRRHGNAVVHAPEFETNVSDADGVSVTVTLSAALGPLFVTVMV